MGYATVYNELVKQHVLPVLRNSANQPAIFMQDNAPLSQGQDSHELFQGRDHLRYGLACSEPRPKHLENVWKILGERSKARNSKTTEQLWTVLKEEWNKISLQDIKI